MGALIPSLKVFKGERSFMAIQLGPSLNEGQSTNRLSLFSGANYTYWKAIMRTFIHAIDHNMWSVIVNDPHILTHIMNNIVTLKPEVDWDEHDKRMA